MKMTGPSAAALAALAVALLAGGAAAFSAAPGRPAARPLSPPRAGRRSRGALAASPRDADADAGEGEHAHTRRAALRRGILASSIAAAVSLPIGDNNAARAALGTLPEFADANAAVQSITVDVTDRSQFDETIAFFTSSFDGMKVLRERGGGGGGVKDAWLGFGPETLSVPPAFEIPVSSLSQYGGHASLHLRYDPSATAPLYKRSGGEFNNEPAPGDNIAYLQLGVPQYRISQMTKHGGNVLDAYGWVNVVSPAGLPVRAIVGIRPDPMMFLAVNCEDVSRSEEFYAKLGFARQEYPYARLNQGQGQFEPPQPAGSAYVAPSPNSMGVLLLPRERKLRKRAVVPNPAVRSMNVVYAPTEGGGGSAGGLDPQFADPSGVPVAFVAQELLEKEIKQTAVPGS